jgi:hypothetical protein
MQQPVPERAGHRPMLSIGALVQMLTDRIDSLVPQLLPAGRRHGAEWVEAKTARGGMGDSLSVRMTGPRAGVWSHFAEGRGGDLLDLIAYLRTGGDKVRAIQWAKDFIGHGVVGAAAADPAALARARKRAKQAKAQDVAESARKRAHAQALWLSAPPIEPGDAVDRYLSGRGIGLLQLGRRPGCLRAGQGVRHSNSGTDWPAMLAAVIGPDGGQVATHRTYLTAEGRKAPVDPVKQVLGHYWHGHIPLWKGRCRRTLREIEPGVPVYISEGIEDGLSVARLLPDARVVAAVSLGNMAALWLPPQVREVVLVGQNDPELGANGKPHPARLALAKAVAAHAEAGRVVKVARPPPGIHDFNDWVRNEETSGDAAA